MGGRRLKELVRKHARKGNMNSFIADFESRLDRVLYRCNAVPSIFAARMAIGHKHVLVNGRVANSTHTVLDPGDVVEPRPGSLHIFKRMMRRRLANNNFVFQKDAAPSPPKVAEAPVQSAVTADIEALLRDGAEVVASYRRLPPPRGALPADALVGVDGGADAGAEATRQSQLDEIVPALVAGLAGDGSRLASEVSRRPQLASAIAPPGQRTATLAWRSAAEPEHGRTATAQSLLTIDRGALRRTLLGLLALRPAGKGSGA